MVSHKESSLGFCFVTDYIVLIFSKRLKKKFRKRKKRECIQKQGGIFVKRGYVQESAQLKKKEKS